MLTKMTSKITLLKYIKAAMASTPTSIQRGDAARTKLVELNLGEQDIADAVDWARQTPTAEERITSRNR